MQSSQSLSITSFGHSQQSSGHPAKSPNIGHIGGSSFEHNTLFVPKVTFPHELKIEAYHFVSQDTELNSVKNTVGLQVILPRIKLVPQVNGIVYSHMLSDPGTGVKFTLPWLLTFVQILEISKGAEPFH